MKNARQPRSKRYRGGRASLGGFVRHREECWDNYGPPVLDELLTTQRRFSLKVVDFMEQPPTNSDLLHRIKMLEIQNSTLLYLSAINLLANCLTIGVAYIAARL